MVEFYKLLSQEIENARWRLYDYKKMLTVAERQITYTDEIDADNFIIEEINFLINMTTIELNELENMISNHQPELIQQRQSHH